MTENNDRRTQNQQKIFGTVTTAPSMVGRRLNAQEKHEVALFALCTALKKRKKLNVAMIPSFLTVVHITGYS